MTSKPIRLAILECDIPAPGTRAKYGGYFGVFSALLAAAASSLSSPPTLYLSAFDVVTAQEYPSLEKIDAVLLTGSKYNSFDNDPWILKLVTFTRTVLDQSRVKIIGICFGHQIVGRALGGDAAVGRSEKGWEVSVTAVELTRRGQEILGIPSLSIHQMHRDVVYSYPEGVEELAYTEKCAVQGMYIEKRMITLQGHPEFNEHIVIELLISRHDSGLFDDEMFKDATERVDKYHDGIMVAKAFLKFLSD